MSKTTKGEYGEAVNEGGYDVLKDHKRALRQTGTGLHPSVLSKEEQKIVSDYDKKRAERPSKRQGTSDGYMTGSMRGGVIGSKSQKQKDKINERILANRVGNPTIKK